MLSARCFVRSVGVSARRGPIFGPRSGVLADYAVSGVKTGTDWATRRMVNSFEPPELPGTQEARTDERNRR